MPINTHLASINAKGNQTAGNKRCFHVKVRLFKQMSMSSIGVSQQKREQIPAGKTAGLLVIRKVGKASIPGVKEHATRTWLTGEPRA